MSTQKLFSTIAVLCKPAIEKVRVFYLEFLGY